MTAQTPGQAYEAPPEAETETERLLGWAATLIACGIPGPEMSPAQWFEGARNWQAARAAAQERPAPGTWTVAECLERIGVLAGALHEIKSVYTPGTMAHDTAHAALDHAAPPAQERPAPDGDARRALLDIIAEVDQLDEGGPTADWIRMLAEHGLGETSHPDAVVAAQERPAPGDARELAMLRADLADAEAQLVKWPKCPAGCSCRLGIEDDADRNECGCDGPCNGGPRPAPELAAEVKRLSAENAALRDDAGDNLKLARKVSEQHAELTALRDWLDEATRAMLNLGTRPAEVNLARKIRKEAGFAP